MPLSNLSRSTLCLLLVFCAPSVSSQPGENPLPRRAYLGVALAERDGVGVSITAVNENSTAWESGVAAGDVVLSIDGEPTNSVPEVQAAIGGHRGGDTVGFSIVRDGERVDLEAALKPVPSEAMQNAVVEYGSVTTDRGVRLRTIASVPNGREGQAPAVLLLQGGGCGSVDAPWTPMPVGTLGLIRSIGDGGFVTMRVEKSGVGDSEGPPCGTIGYYEELAGFRAGLEALKSHPAADPDRIFLLGISLGGVFAPILANEADVAGISVYSTLARPPYPYPGRSERFFEEFEDVDVHAAWEAIDVPVQLIRGEYDELRAEMRFLARLLGETNPGATEYLELEKLDHCWTRHETYEASIDNCGRGAASSDLTEAVLEFLNANA
jgi:pimeloyl-ACP methyl ester carboxylesterase